MALPLAVNDQSGLLTLNINEEPAIDLDHLIPGMKLWPLYLDPDSSTWVLYVRYAPGTRLPQHFHTGSVHVFTVKGQWNYMEHSGDKQTAGSYLYEPPGSVHSFGVPDDSEEPAEAFMVVNGVNVNFDAEGNYLGTDHAGSMEQIILECARQQGVDMPRYIRPSGKPAMTC